jgi:hypothetical protein
MKYKFNIDNKEPAADKIDKYRDFKKLKANYDESVKPLYKKPLYRDKKAFLVVLIIALLTYILVEVFGEDKKEDKKDPQTQQHK